MSVFQALYSLNRSNPLWFSHVLCCCYCCCCSPQRAFTVIMTSLPLSNQPPGVGWVGIIRPVF